MSETLSKYISRTVPAPHLGRMFIRGKKNQSHSTLGYTLYPLRGWIQCCIIMVFALSVNHCFADGTGKDYWGVLGGYGMSHPGWGQTTEDVETVDLLFRYSHVLDRDLGRSWWKGNHELWVELPIMTVIKPGNAAMVSLNFLVCWVFTASDAVSPYILAGGGPLYTGADIEGVGSDLCGNYLAGGGFRIALGERIAFNLEARYHHISNLGFADPNVPINSTKFLSGFTFSF